MTQLIVTAESLSVRDAPDVSGDVIGYLAKNNVVEWRGTSNDHCWFKVQANNGKIGWASYRYLQFVDDYPPNPRPSPSDFPWFAIAQQEERRNIKEIPGVAAHPRIVEYLHSTNLGFPANSTDETPWCSGFVNWCVEKAGYAGTDSAGADSWLYWGRETHHPVPGCIVVFHRTLEGGHVAFFVSSTNTHVKLLGGNQSDSVCRKEFLKSRVKSYRVPSNYAG